MAQEYHTQLAYDKYFPMSRSQQRQSLAVQWPPCHPDTSVGAYHPPLWPQDAYPHPEHSMSGFPTPPSPQMQAYESDHPRSVSRSPEYQGKQWPNDVIYADALSSSIPTTASSPRHALPSRPASSVTPGTPTGAQSRPSPARPSPERQKPKLEVTEDVQIGFVMEPMGSVGRSLPVFTPLPMEVPLRATQASGNMRKMMTVFRLNPFALQSGEAKRSGSVCSSDSSSSADSIESSPRQFEARPLEEEPLIFEFQVQLDDPELLVPESERTQDTCGKGKAHAGAIVDSPLSSPTLPLLDVNSDDSSLHSFPPDFELHREAFEYQGNNGARSSWEDSDGFCETCRPGSAHYLGEPKAFFGPSPEIARRLGPHLICQMRREYHSQQNSRAGSSQVYPEKTARHGYQYSYDPRLGPGPLPTPYRADYSNMYSQDQESLPPRSRTVSPLAEEISYQTPARNLTIDNSEIYSQDQPTFYGNVGSVNDDPSTTSSHRRWSLPAEASGAILMTSHGTSHVHARMAMSSHSNDAFLVSQMR